jgi:hypothetical protein
MGACKGCGALVGAHEKKPGRRLGRIFKNQKNQKQDARETREYLLVSVTDLLQHNKERFSPKNGNWARILYWAYDIYVAGPSVPPSMASNRPQIICKCRRRRRRYWLCVCMTDWTAGRLGSVLIVPVVQREVRIVGCAQIESYAGEG